MIDAGVTAALCVGGAASRRCVELSPPWVHSRVHDRQPLEGLRMDWSGDSPPAAGGGLAAPATLRPPT